MMYFFVVVVSFKISDFFLDFSCQFASGWLQKKIRIFGRIFLVGSGFYILVHSYLMWLANKLLTMVSIG